MSHFKISRRFQVLSDAAQDARMLKSNIPGLRIVGHGINLPPVAAILSLLAGAQLFGILARSWLPLSLPPPES